MFVGRRSRYFAAVMLVGCLVPLAVSSDREPAKQREAAEEDPGARR